MVPAKARVVVRGNAFLNLERFGEVVSIGDREIVYVNDAATAAEVVKEVPIDSLIQLYHKRLDRYIDEERLQDELKNL